jgi:histone acetyltransferase MYST1
LLGKLFIDNKTLFYEVDGFDFYVLCHCDNSGEHFVGYFSRELASDYDNILACFLVLPQFQHKGYGRLLIELSYEIARRCSRLGGPEKPLSDLGDAAFRAYWRSVVLETLKKDSSIPVSLRQLERFTWIQKKDMLTVMEDLGVGEMRKGKWLLGPRNRELMNVLNQFQDKPPPLRLNLDNLWWFPDHEVDMDMDNTD